MKEFLPCPLAAGSVRRQAIRAATLLRELAPSTVGLDVRVGGQEIHAWIDELLGQFDPDEARDLIARLDRSRKTVDP